MDHEAPERAQQRDPQGAQHGGERAEHGLPSLPLGPGGEAATLLRLAQILHRLVHADEQHDRNPQRERALARDAGDPVEAPVEDEAQQAEGCAPGAGAQNVVGKKAAVR